MFKNNKLIEGNQIYAAFHKKSSHYLKKRINFVTILNLRSITQPFISTGNYTNFKIITETHAIEFKDRYHLYTNEEISFDANDDLYNIDENRDGNINYSIANPDFSYRQFNSNFVVRWEYLPGSTVYFVWSQGRTSSVSNGVFSYTDDMKDLFNVYPHNVFLIKLSYWFSR